MHPNIYENVAMPVVVRFEAVMFNLSQITMRFEVQWSTSKRDHCDLQMYVT